jgi:hypothetical protein
MLGTIDLSDEEAGLLALIDFRSRKHEDLRRSCAASAQIVPLLLDRGAIPPHRLRYFNDPEYNNGTHSRHQAFKRHGRSFQQVIEHPHFLKHLRYLIHGTDLTVSVQHAMADAVGEPAHFTSGDLEPLCVLARRLARQHSLGPTSSNAFFQLTLDLGLAADIAHQVRQAVARVR